MKRKTTMGAKTPRRSFSRADVEHLLAGTIPEGGSVDQLVPLVQALERVGEYVPTEAEAQRFADDAARLTPTAPRPPLSRAPRAHGASSVPERRLNARLAGAAAALVLVLLASAGVAYAADGAVPGDVLYGLDLGLEKMGIGNGGLQERLTEASRLVERGRAQEGLTHAGEAIAASAAGDEDLIAAAAALRAAADAVANDQNLQSPEERDLVAEKLRWMASTEPTANEFGQAVLDLAGDLVPEGQQDDDAGQGETNDDSNAGGDGGQGATDSTENNGDGSESGNGNGSGNGPPR